jgi:hypothetical protein
VASRRQMMWWGSSSATATIASNTADCPNGGSAGWARSTLHAAASSYRLRSSSNPVIMPVPRSELTPLAAPALLHHWMVGFPTRALHVSALLIAAAVVNLPP